MKDEKKALFDLLYTHFNNRIILFNTHKKLRKEPLDHPLNVLGAQLADGTRYC